MAHTPANYCLRSLAVRWSPCGRWSRVRAGLVQRGPLTGPLDGMPRRHQSWHPAVREGATRRWKACGGWRCCSWWRATRASRCSASEGRRASPLFFVLSGYLITARLVREREATGSIRLGHFYARRAFRLLPALIVVLTGGSVLAIAFGASGGDTSPLLHRWCTWAPRPSSPTA